MITVGVTGAPKLWWDESEDSFVLTKGLHISGLNGVDCKPGSDVDTDLITVGVTGTPRLWWDEPADVFTFNKSVTITGITSIYAPYSENILGSELVTNWDFVDIRTGWTAGANWSYSGGDALHTPGSQATLVSASVGVASGSRYRLQVVVGQYSAGTCAIALTNSSGMTFADFGTAGCTVYFKASGAGTVITITPSSDFAGSIVSVSIKVVTQNAEVALNLYNTDGVLSAFRVKAGGVERPRLARARAGTRYIMERAWNPETGSVATFISDGRPGPEPPQRTTQSLAYALVGPSFYYYLTRDPETLEFIRSVRRHVFEQYWSEDWRMLRWTNADFGDDTANRKELVAQLDQINAYMLLMLPLLEPEERKAWEADLRRLVGAMLRDFHDPESKRFFGYVHDEKGRHWGERHNDFGHTIKAYWMLYFVGTRLNDDEWVHIAESGIDSSLKAAYVRRTVADAPDWQAEVMREAAGGDPFYYVWSNRPDGIGIA